MIEPIAEALIMVNVNMTFTGFSLPCIPGFELNTLYKGAQSLYEITKPDYIFKVATVDIALLTLDGLTFTLTDDVFLYTFLVNRPPLHDLTGWSDIYADFKGQVNV